MLGLGKVNSEGDFEPFNYQGTELTLFIENLVDVLFVSKNQDVKDYLISVLEQRKKRTERFFPCCNFPNVELTRIENILQTLKNL